MRTIAMVSWKGGTGKTLLAFNTAERAAASGLKTLMCDFDPQQTLIRQTRIRQRAQADRLTLPIEQGDLSAPGLDALDRVIEDAEHDLLICDLPGADTFTMDRALDAMDALMIPITAAPYEIMITAQLVHKGIVKGWPMYLVPNNLPPIRSRREAMLTTLAGMGIEVAPAAIVRRVTHWDAGLNGLGVCEFAPSSPAADEIQDYWDWLVERFDLSAADDAEIWTPAEQEVVYA